MSIAGYFIDYFETNRYTLALLLFLGGVTLLKYAPRRRGYSTRTLLFLILLLGLGLRLLWLGFSSAEVNTSWDEPGRGEYDLVNLHAIDIQRGVWFVDAQGEPTLRRPIGYPLFLALLYRIFGVSIHVAWTAHLALYAATAVLLYAMASSIFSQRTALWTAFFFSVYPIAIYTTKMLLDEHLFMLLWFLGLWLLIRHIRGNPIPWSPVWYGLIFGYATMTRTHAIFMPFVVALVVYLVKRSWTRALAFFGVVLLVMQLVNLPWVIRNYRIWGVPVLYTAGSCWLYSRLNSSATPEGGGAIPGSGEPDYSEELEAARDGNQAYYDRLCSEAMLRWIVRHPLEFLNLGVKKWLVFMGWDRKGVWPIWYQYYPGNFDPSQPLSQGVRHALEEMAYVFYYVLFFSFTLGCIFLVRRWGRWSGEMKIALMMVGSIFFFWLVEHLIIFADRKYRYPLEPLMIMVACAFVDYLACEFRWKMLGPRARKLKGQ